MIQPTFWTDGNEYLIKGDYIYQNYPTQTFGLGPRTNEDDIDYINFSHIRIYQVVLKQIFPDFFLGLGYSLDDYWDITQEGSFDKNARSTFSNYGFTTKSISSGSKLVAQLK